MSCTWPASRAARAALSTRSGAGNTPHGANHYVRKLIVDSLRYWVREQHVDGFRFDLAPVFTRSADGALSSADPSVFGGIFSAPDLAEIQLIAEPRDAAGVYQLGRGFPGVRWLQWNGRFRGDLRRFGRGDGTMIGALMQGPYGSEELFPDARASAINAYQRDGGDTAMTRG
jgi:glycogen operon protein